MLPSFQMPPAKLPSTELPLIVLLTIVSVALLPTPPVFQMPPAKPAELPLTVLLLTVSVPRSLTMPPPTPPLAFPFVMVRPEIVTVWPAMLNTLLVPPPFTDSTFAPGPEMVTL